MSIAQVVAERARRSGPLRFDEVMDLALYHPDHGFYETSAGAGRSGADFLTSPELGPLFGAVLARAVDSWWAELDHPDPFVVVEAGAGGGSLAASVLAAHPRCAPALRYVLVDRSSRLCRRQAERLALEPPSQVLGPVLSADPDEEATPLRGIGPLVTSLSELPAGRFTGIVLANELVDNLACRLLQSTPQGWSEIYVDHRLAEVLVPADPAVRLAGDFPLGSRVPLQEQAGAWLAKAVASLRRGRVVIFDYGDYTESMARRPWRQWLRSYRSHAAGVEPLAHLGEQDITCEVAVDQLANVRTVTRNRSQAEFLAAHGVEELAAQARERWLARAHIGDLEALKWRSRLGEAAALVDPAGLGAFRVLEWEVPSPG